MPTVWAPHHRPSTDIRWPTSHEVAGRATWRDAVRRLKHGLRVWLSQPSLPVIQAVADDAPWVTALLKKHPRLLCPITSWYLDRRWTLQERTDAMAATLKAMGHLFPVRARWHIADGRHLRILDLDDGFHLALGLNELSYHEGLWSLSLRDSEHRRLFNLSFGLLPGGAMLIGSIQGPNGDDRVDLIRRLTKAAHGLRPPHLLMEALRALAQRREPPVAIRGLDPAHHVKGRWNLRGRRLRFDYRAFWEECEAVPPLASGRVQQDDPCLHWQLPAIRRPRDLADVPSKKRAMYRRREEWLSAMAQAFRQLP